MRKCKRPVFVLLLLTVFSVLTMTMAWASFDDVDDNAWYGEYIGYVTQRELFQGISDSKFAPDDTMTRAMFVTVLSRIDLKEYNGCPASGFSDVPAGSWYEMPVNWGRDNAIVEGISSNRFGPDEPVTREQMCTFILRMCSYLSYSLPQQTAPVSFSDAEEISYYARSAVSACQAAGLITGYEDGTMRPQNTATRAEVSAVLTRLGRLLQKAGYTVGPGCKEDDWRLILVNPWNYIPDGYVDGLSLKSVANDRQVDARIYDDFKEMMAAMNKAGLYPTINSAFRTHAYQQYLFDREVQEYLSYGYSYSRARELAAQWVAVPGTSEHELGLAVDLAMYASNSTAVHTWLQNNSYLYGFIYRYPEGKKDITGINPEPWHYRYVGKEHAYAMYYTGLCLEEYLAQ